jgi:hypothetical protein
MLRRIILATTAAFAAVIMSGGSVWAFECYNASRSDQGDTAAGDAAALLTLEEALAEFAGLCPEGIDHVVTGLEVAGFDTGILINGHALMARGLEETGKEDKLHDGQGVDHLSEAFFAAADPLIGEAFGLCGGA